MKRCPSQPGALAGYAILALAGCLLAFVALWLSACGRAACGVWRKYGKR